MSHDIRSTMALQVANGTMRGIDAEVKTIPGTMRTRSWQSLLYVPSGVLDLLEAFEALEGLLLSPRNLFSTLINALSGACALKPSPLKRRGQAFTRPEGGALSGCGGQRGIPSELSRRAQRGVPSAAAEARGGWPQSSLEAGGGYPQCSLV